MDYEYDEVNDNSEDDDLANEEDVSVEEVETEDGDIYSDTHLLDTLVYSCRNRPGVWCPTEQELYFSPYDDDV